MKIKIQRFGKPYEPRKEARNRRNALIGIALFLLAAILIVAGASIAIEAAIRHWVVPGQEGTQAASIASYWGGIIGGVVSGILAFLGVFYTIRYYKESDAQKERAEVQPFLLVELGQDPRHDLRKGFSLGERSEDKEKQQTIHVTIKNIGHGFAKTLVIHTGFNIGGFAFNKVITVGDCTYTYFVINEESLKAGATFALQYIDSMTNEYIQEYSVKEEYSTIDIECGYPKLLEQ